MLSKSSISYVQELLNTHNTLNFLLLGTINRVANIKKIQIQFSFFYSAAIFDTFFTVTQKLKITYEKFFSYATTCIYC